MSTPSVLPRLTPAPVVVHPLRPALARAALLLILVVAAILAEPVAGELATVGTVAGLVLLRMIALLRGSRALGRPSLPYFPAVGRVVAYGSLGLGQAGLVWLVWWHGPGVGVLAPLLVALPLLEVWVGWHRARLAAGLRHEDRERYLRYVRRLGWATLAPLLPPLVAGAALLGMAGRLPYGLSAHPDAPGTVLWLAGGVLLAGVVALSWLLGARGRPWLALLITAPALVAAGASAAVAATGGDPVLVASGGDLVLALAGAYVVGLVLAAYVLFDARSGGPA